LTSAVDLLRLDASRRLDPERQVELGQFLTPAPVARFMASMFGRPGRTVRLLDAGAGIGSLSAAWVAEMCGRPTRPKTISVTAYELDPALAGELATTLEACRRHCEAAGIGFEAEVRQEDFVAAVVSDLRGGLFGVSAETYDSAILNPPYRKINAGSRTHRLLEAVEAETTNLYTAFLSLAVRLLRPGGELVAITPRSFCNGPYFRSFRKSFLDAMTLRHIHCFEARDRAFSDDEVLQENVIFHAEKGGAARATIHVSASLGPDDECHTGREVEVAHVVKPHDPERFIHIPADALSEGITERMEQFDSTLAGLGLEVSTGRVVDFRSADFLRAEPGPDTVPLIYPGHMSAGFVQWPKLGGKKPNALVARAATQDLLIPTGFYVLVKRFSSKEERRRITAAVFDPGRVASTEVAFENHLNYFHAGGRPLSRNQAFGLAAFLNSTLVDSHFRQWSGHTQVNASDLRRLGYPSPAQLDRLGKTINGVFPGQDELDTRIEEELLDMPSLKKKKDPIRAKKRLAEATSILTQLGMPRGQQNVRSALTLLALLDLKPGMTWAEASSPARGISEMMGFFADHYGKVYAPNTRETVRRSTVHQFVQAGIAITNPDNLAKPTNSPQTVYQIEPGALELLKTFGTGEWDKALQVHLGSMETLRSRYAREREMERIPLKLADGKTISLTPGGQNVLVKQIIEDFCPRFTPGGQPIYVGDTAEKWAHFEVDRLRALGVEIEAHGKMPDVVVHHAAKNWLVLIEAVTSHGPVNPKRHHELKELFGGSTAGLVFVTAFLTRRDLTRYLGDIAWETEVWVAESPSHLIHFNGERFLGPF
jgi:adenine-specific DNA-methyltransferase